MARVEREKEAMRRMHAPRTGAARVGSGANNRMGSGANRMGSGSRSMPGSKPSQPVPSVGTKPSRPVISNRKPVAPKPQVVGSPSQGLSINPTNNSRMQPSKPSAMGAGRTAMTN